MRVLLMTYGSRGDVEPFLALGRGFVKAGHTACLAGPEPYAGLAAGTGVEYIPLPGKPDELVAAMVREAGGNPLRMVRVMVRFILPLAAEVYARLQTAAPDSDAVVHSFLMTQTGYEIARTRGIPDFSAQMFPMFAPTAAFAAPGFPDLPLSGVFRKFSHILWAGIMRHGGGLLYGRARRSHPDLPPLTGWPFSPAGGRLTPILFGFSRHVIPRPPEWPSSAHITGYWQMDPPPEEEIPSDLRRFIESGPAPVSIGFGSIIPRDVFQLSRLALEALERTGQRGIISCGRSIALRQSASRDILAAESVAHRWLFPRMAAVVHHGGAGTTGAGLRAGVANILVPFTADQPFWAARVQALGAGPAPIPLRKLTAERLAAAIDRGLHDEALRARCRMIGKKIDAEDGVAQAVELVLRDGNPSAEDKTICPTTWKSSSCADQLVDPNRQDLPISIRSTA
jgi:sterol 3beta-glucosyltransferase